MLMAYFNQLQLIVWLFGLGRALWLPGFGLQFFLAARFTGPRLHLFLVFVDAFLDPLRDKLGLLLGLPRLLVGTGNFHRLLLGLGGNLVVLGHQIISSGMAGWGVCHKGASGWRLLGAGEGQVSDHSTKNLINQQEAGCWAEDHN